MISRSMIFRHATRQTGRAGPGRIAEGEFPGAAGARPSPLDERVKQKLSRGVTSAADPTPAPEVGLVDPHARTTTEPILDCDRAKHLTTFVTELHDVLPCLI